jgi:hypothetical protein
MKGCMGMRLDPHRAVLADVDDALHGRVAPPPEADLLHPLVVPHAGEEYLQRLGALLR